MVSRVLLLGKERSTSGMQQVKIRIREGGRKETGVRRSLLLLCPPHPKSVSVAHSPNGGVLHTQVEVPKCSRGKKEYLTLLHTFVQ